MNRIVNALAVLGGLGFLLLAWAAASTTVAPLFLPGPVATVTTTADLLRDPAFRVDLFVSVRRIMEGFALAVAIGLPIGYGLGLSRWAMRSFGPIVDAFRYVPVNAFIPLLILSLGIGDGEKVVVIALGTAPYFAAMTADSIGSVRREYLESAQTLGHGAIGRVVFVTTPAALPAIWDALRVSIALAWTCLLTAELVGANQGLGAFIILSQRFLRADQIMASVLLIGMIGIGTDLALKYVYRRAFRWSVILNSR